MATFLVSYDLRKDRDYESLYYLLGEALGGHRILESLWRIEIKDSPHSHTVKSLTKDILKAMDNDDGLVVARVSDYSLTNSD